MPRDESIDPDRAESPSESVNERLWNLVETRTRADRSSANGHVKTGTNGCGLNGDAVLVDALYETLQELNASGGTDTSAARARLLKQIHSTSAAAAMRTPARRPFWSGHGRRQVLAAAALILVIAAAIAYIVWSAWPTVCGAGAQASPVLNETLKLPAPASMPAPAPSQRLPAAPSRNKSIAPAAGASIITPAVHRCL